MEPVLSRLKVKNFKSIGDPGIDLELKPLTILVGPNGSGKSSILEALAILNTTVGQTAFKLQGELVQFQAYEEIAFKHELGQWITWEIYFSRESGIRYEHRPDSGEERETLIVNGQEAIQFILEGNRQQGLRLFVSAQGARGTGAVGTGLVKFDSTHYNPPSNVGLIANALDRHPLSPDIIAALEQGALIMSNAAVVLKERLFLLSSLRGSVPPQARTGEVPRWVGIKGEGLVALMSILQQPLYETTWRKIEYWADQFGLPKLKAFWWGGDRLEAHFVDPELNVDVNLAFAGQGTRQLASVITQLFWAQSHSIIMVEEPEISLHPEAQVKLGELFAEAIKEDKQIMVTTHSDFLLLSLGEAVKKGLKVEDIAVYHVTKDAEGTKAKPFKLSKRGYPLGWPPSFEKVQRRLAISWSEGLPSE